MGPLVSVDGVPADARFVDASWALPGTSPDGPAQFLTAHIPGAVHFDIDAIADTDSDLPHMLPDAGRFAAAVGALGIGREDPLVVYDSTGVAMAAARVWWTFRVFGHPRVAVLDGGLPAWSRAGLRLASGPAAPVAPQRYDTRLTPQLFATADLVAMAVERGVGRLVDARSAGRFAGTEPEPRPGLRAGHIPGARSLPWTELVDQASGRLRAREELRQAFDAGGVGPEDRLIACCGSGVTAAVIALARSVLGRDDTAVYDGSWAEWGRPGPRPIATGVA